jgi:hypothetical protein
MHTADALVGLLLLWGEALDPREALPTFVSAGLQSVPSLEIETNMLPLLRFRASDVPSFVILNRSRWHVRRNVASGRHNLDDLESEQLPIHEGRCMSAETLYLTRDSAWRDTPCPWPLRLRLPCLNFRSVQDTGRVSLKRRQGLNIPVPFGAFPKTAVTPGVNQHEHVRLRTAES